METPQSELVLRPHSATPIGGCLGLGFFALFWNGITGAVSYGFLTGGLGWASIFLVLFFIPFWIIGLALLALFIGSIGALFNPRPTLSLGRDTVKLGQTVPFSFTFGSGLAKPKGVKITLEGREEATFRRGTDSITEKATFFHQTVYEASTFQTSGQGEFTLPPDSMHSLDARNNKILWILAVHAPIGAWPDVKAEWKLRVEPRDQ